jgi:hypothetical protein
MQSLLTAYKDTGEGKDSLDEITKKLAEAYNLEGDALAKLTGKYEDYERVLESARDARRQEL